jgi:hypothetical protein
MRPTQMPFQIANPVAFVEIPVPPDDFLAANDLLPLLLLRVGSGSISVHWVTVTFDLADVVSSLLILRYENSECYL